MPTDPCDRDAILALDDTALATACELEFFKGSGNGGQKRNKTSSAVRLRHRASGLTAEDCTERSQHRNRATALRKLRMRLALEIRHSPARPLPRPECALGHPDYPLWCARLADALAEHGWEPKDAAPQLGFSTSALLKFLYRDPQLWQFVNRQRQAAGLPPLRR